MARHTARLGAGIMVGGLLALGATVAQREIMRRAGTRLVDWERVRQLARQRLGGAAVPIRPADRAAAEAFYRSTLERIEPLIAEEIGRELPEALEHPAVVDRMEWIDLNLATFRALFERIEAVILEAQRGPDTAGRAISRWLNRTVGNQQLGFLLAFLARKVLGQYDVSLLAAGPTRGRLHFVEQNIAATAASLRIPRDDFRTFIALHEATHAFEFEAHPWLRTYFTDLVGESIESLAADSGGMLRRLGEALSAGEGHWLERLMTPAQRASFTKTQALMSLLEGYSNHVMHEVGRRVLDDADDISRRFERRGERRGPLERAILRITGLDLKLEQYAAGERFVDAVIAERGRDLLARCWEGPDLLPTLDEIRDPPAWIARVDAIPAPGGPR